MGIFGGQKPQRELSAEDFAKQYLAAEDRLKQVLYGMNPRGVCGCGIQANYLDLIESKASGEVFISRRCLRCGGFQKMPEPAPKPDVLQVQQPAAVQNVPAGGYVPQPVTTDGYVPQGQQWAQPQGYPFIPQPGVQQ